MCIGGKFGVDGSTDTSEALAIAGEIIPEVGIILKAIAGSINIKNENEIIAKLKKVSQMIPDD